MKEDPFNTILAIFGVVFLFVVVALVFVENANTGMTILAIFGVVFLFVVVAVFVRMVVGCIVFEVGLRRKRKDPPSTLKEQPDPEDKE